jgi:tetratricopeptide (TPR) repeat protein/transcriptional regulator with XRE-family HTH domain
LFGDVVRARRARQGLTQEALAQAAGVGLRTIRDVEAGRIARPRPSTVRQLADSFGLSGPERDRFHESALQPAARDPDPDQAGAGGWAGPAQLPMDVPSFTGRADDLRTLRALLDGADRPPAVLISAIGGTAGVGKTALAVHWAHQVSDRFPDGQLYVNLRGFDPGGAVTDPAEALHGFLTALQVAAQRIPATLEARAALFRSLVAGRRLLVLLDNARDSDQVRHLLPGAPGCLVLVTSRNHLTGLVAAHAARPLILDLLSAAEAEEFLVSRLGSDRVAAEPRAVDDIIARCARLPLALAVVAAHAATAPRLALDGLARQLDVHRRLDTLTGDAPTADVRAVFSWSYRALTPPAARLFRLLGLHPGPEVTAAAAASLAALPPARAGALLAELTRTNLLTEPARGRYTFHDLLRAYATELVHRHESDDQRRAATGRVLDHYVQTACAADRMIDPYRDPIPVPDPGRGVTPHPLADAGQAMTWFTTERPGLVAAVRLAADAGFDASAWRLAWAVMIFFQRRFHVEDWVSTQRIAVAAAERLADRRAAAEAHRGLGRAYVRSGGTDAAERHLRRAWALFGQLDLPADQAHTSLCLGVMFARQRHQLPEAISHTAQALDLARAAGHGRWQAAALNDLGWYHVQQGDPRLAVTYCRQAIDVLRRGVGDPVTGADTWHTLGYARQLLGQHARAEECYRRALRLYRRIGDRYHEAGCHTYLGDNHLAVGDTAAARRAWQAALVILEDLHHPDAEPVRAKLTTAPPSGECGRAEPGSGVGGEDG